MQAIFLDDDQKVNSFVETISKPRLTRYLQESRGDTREALLLYHWNSQLSQALYLPLQSWEVSLRNKLNNFFVYKYGPNWPFDSRAERNFAGNDRFRLGEAIKRQQDASGSARPSTDHIVADLSAGFWVSQFGRNYAAHYGWKANLKWRIFPHDHSITREDADGICNDLLDLRNRVAHHEPIFHLDLEGMRDDMELLLRGMCSATGLYMSSACSFAAIWSARPGTALVRARTAPERAAGRTGGGVD